MASSPRPDLIASPSQEPIWRKGVNVMVWERSNLSIIHFEVQESWPRRHAWLHLESALRIKGPKGLKRGSHGLKGGDTEDAQRESTKG